jgi:mannose-1-phosphate guanylyltransferase
MEEINPNYYAVILAGGGGTRLWPKSRKKTPKHLLKLFGDKSLLRLTYDRVEPIIPKENIFVITSKHHETEVREDLPAVPPENIIAEPEAKNTALAMGAASAVIASRNPNAAISFFAADHIVEKPERFNMNVLASLRVAESGDYIVAIGIKPQFPHTGLGYIKVGAELDKESKIAKKGFVFKGLGFKEKPNLVTAQSFVASGQYLWNANLYTWSVSTIFKAFEKYSPELFKAIEEIKNGGGTQSVIDKVYAGVGKPDSIDYEISEKADNIVVIPGDFGWNDVGDWKVVYDLKSKDKNGDVVVNPDVEYINIGSNNLLVEADKKMVVAIGLKNIVIIETDDAILVCNKDNTQDVKKAVEKLKIEGKDKYL